MANNASLQNRTRLKYINDIDKLVEIADLLARNPAMKRTTAIRAIGIEDPKTIRRLRKKLSPPQSKSSNNSSVAQSFDEKTASFKKLSQSQLAKVPSRGQKQELSKAAAKRGQTKNSKVSFPKEQSEKCSAKIEKPDLISCIFAANLSASQALFQVQFKLWSFAFQASPLAIYLRNEEIIRLTLQNIKIPAK